MKKTLYFITTFCAFSLVLMVSTNTAQASSTPTYYAVAANNRYVSTPACTSPTSDLGLGGGVFVAGTTVCQSVLYVPVQYNQYPSTNYNQNYSSNNDDYSYDNYDDPSDDYYYDDEDDSPEYDQDDSSYDEPDYTDSGSNNGNSIW